MKLELLSGKLKDREPVLHSAVRDGNEEAVLNLINSYSRSPEAFEILMASWEGKTCWALAEVMGYEGLLTKAREAIERSSIPEPSKQYLIDEIAERL